MVRGDSESITIHCHDSDNQSIPFEIGDTVYFTVKLKYADTDYVIQKIATEFQDGNAVIEIKPEDTKQLQFNRDYFYDIQVTRVDGAVTTIVPCSIFRVGVEITDE